MIELPLLSTEQMNAAAQLIQAAMIPLAAWQEQVGQRLALLAQQLLADDLVDRPIVVLAGQGWHGGAGLVAARVLTEAGAWVQVVLTAAPEGYDPPADQWLAALQALAVPLAWAEEGWELPPADLLIDTLLDSEDPALGTAVPQGKVRELIQLANSSLAPILSLGAPSGLAVGREQANGLHIQANATLLWWLLPAGWLADPARSAYGDLYLAPLDPLAQLYQQFVPALSSDLLCNSILPVSVYSVWA